MLVEELEIAFDDAAVASACPSDVGDRQTEVHGIADEQRRTKPPVSNAQHRDGRTAEQPGSVQQSGQDCQTEKAIHDALPVNSAPGELDIGVDGIEIATEPGESDDVGLGDGACGADEGVAGTELFEVLRLHCLPYGGTPRPDAKPGGCRRA